MKGHELDGLKIEENLRQSKRHFSLCETSCSAQFKPDVTSHLVDDPDTKKDPGAQSVLPRLNNNNNNNNLY